MKYIWEIQSLSNKKCRNTNVVITYINNDEICKLCHPNVDGDEAI